MVMVVMMSVIMLNVANNPFMFSVVIPNVITLNATMLCVIMLSVIMLSVMAPFSKTPQKILKTVESLAASQIFRAN